MHTLWQDLRFGARMLLKKPGFSSIAVITLALGIGANTAIFSVVKNVLINPLPYQRPDQLVMLWENDTQEGNDRNSVAPANFADWKQLNESCTDLAFYGQPGGINVTGLGEPERMMGAGVSGNIFSVLGVSPILGRDFTVPDGKNDPSSEIIISFGLWQRRFGRDDSVVGRSIILEGRPFNIAGVMPPKFTLPEEAEIWYQTRNGELPIRKRHFLRALGRLKPDVSLAQAQANFTTVAQRLEEQYPDSNIGRGINVVPFREQFTGNVRRALLVIFVAVGCVLLIACANVANLLLVRAAGRRSELAIRVALGAGRFRMMRQLLTESTLLAIAGGTLGLLLALWGVDLLSGLTTVKSIASDKIAIDAGVFAFAIGVILLTGLACGLVPAWQASQLNLHDTLKEGRSAAGTNPRGHRLRSLLVISEIALSLVLLIGAGLMIRSFARLMAVEPGFDPHNVLTMQLSLSSIKYDSSEKLRTSYRQILERLSALPGVVSAGAINRMPMAGDRATSGMRIEGRDTSPGEGIEVHYRIVTPGYFSTLNIPLRAGRELSERDTQEAPGVLMINEIAARRYWAGSEGNQDPIGKRIKLGPDANAPWMTIVGVVGDALNFGLDADARPEVYLSHQQNPDSRMRVVLRTSVPPHSIVSGIREAVGSVDSDLPLAQVLTMEELFGKSVAQRRLNMWLLGFFAALALILAAMGIYGVMSYAIGQRTHEIGVRMALGAQSRDVLRLVIRHGMLLTFAGLSIGLLASFALTGLMSSLLFGVSATDPLTFLAIAALLMLVALLACFIPARRATKVDPLVALRMNN